MNFVNDTISPFMGSPIATPLGLIPDGMLPSGYMQKELRDATVVAHGSTMPFFDEMMRAHRTLHAWASQQPTRRAMQGRQVAWSAPLPDSEVRAVVRHSHHGGMLASLTRDVFLVPRAPDELRISWTLRHVGIRTPRVLGYALYPLLAGQMFRADVVTQEVVHGVELLQALTTDVADFPRDACIEATLTLLRRLARIWAHHRDLNCKNILLATTETGEIVAYVLDVDTLRFADKQAESRNASRLLQSVRKLNATARSAGLTQLATRLVR